MSVILIQQVQYSMKTAILYALALFWQIYKFFKIKNSYRWCKKVIKQIQQLEALSISGLKNKIIDGTCKIGENVLCKGRLVASETMRSILDPSKYVAYSELVMDKVFQIGDSRNTVRKNIRKLYSGFLKLYQNKQHVKIYQVMDSNMIHNKLISRVKSYRQRIFNFSWLVSIFLRSPTRMISNVYKQTIIQNNTQNTVFGRIFRNKSGELQFFKPIAIASSKQKMIMFYKEQLDNLTFLWYLLTLTIIITALLIVKYCIQPFILRRKSFILKKNSELNKIQQIQVKDRNCYKCHKSLSNVINNPCWHLAICSQCNNTQSKCLECQKKPKELIVVYPC